MQAFEYLGVLVSVVIGLAVTHLVLGVIKVIHSRQSTAVYWVHMLWVFNVLYVLLGFWWWFFAWQDLSEWSRATFFLFIAYALALTIAAGILFPLAGTVSDFKKFFFEHSRWFFAAMVLVLLLDIVEVIAKANFGIRPIPEYYFIYMAILISCLVIAMITNDRRYHGALAVLYFVATVGYDFVVFSKTV